MRPLLLATAEDFKYSKEYYSSRIFRKYDRLDAYLALYIKCDKPENLKTATEIGFLKGLKFGAGIKEVISALPSPRYEVLDNGAFKIKVIFYKIVIGEYRVKCHIHFFDDRMFLCSYTFSYLKEGEQEKVTGILKKKYLPDMPVYSGQTISDGYGNCICLDTSVDLTFNYLSLKDGLYEGIRQYKEEADNQKEERISANEEDLFNRL
jgi:hypothetical protein